MSVDRSTLDGLRARLADELVASAAWVSAAWDLVLALDEAFVVTNVLDLLSESIDLERRLVTALAPGERRRQVLSSLGVDLTQRYQHTSDAKDLSEATTLGRSLVKDASAASWVTDRVNLGARLLLAWDTRSDEAALHEAIELLSDAVVADGVDDEGRAALAANLANAYGHRFDLRRERVDLDACLRWYRVALAGADADRRAGLESNLATALVDAYRTTGDSGALDEAVELTDHAVQSGGTPHARALRWDTRALVFYARFERDGAQADLLTASTSSQHALALVPANASARSGMVATGVALAFERFILMGDQDALTMAIDAATEALEHANQLDRHDRVALTNQLCMALNERFELNGDSRDLEHALDAVRTALVPGLRLDMELGLRTNLSLALHQRYTVSHKLRDLNDAIKEIDTVLDRTPSSPERPARLNAAGLLHTTRAERTGRTDDLERAIGAGREAIEQTSASSQDRGIYMTNVAAWLDSRFERTSDRGDLDEAIVLLEQALELVADDSTHRARIAFTLAGRLSVRHERFAAPDDVADLQRACDLWDDALAADEPFISVFAGQHLGNVAFQRGMWSQCEQALSLSLAAARTLTGRRVVREDRERARFEVQGTAAVAALAACRDGRPIDAVVHLESGAATLLAGAIDLPSLAVAFDEIVQAARTLGGPLVYWAVTNSGAVAMVVSPGGVLHPVEIDVTTEAVGAALQALRDAFDGDHDDPLEAWTAATDELLAWTSTTFVAPIEPLVTEAPVVGLIPIGRLAWLPLGAARTSSRVSLMEGAIVHVLTNAKSITPQARWPQRLEVFVAADPGPSSRHLDRVLDEARAVAALYRDADVAVQKRPAGPHHELRRLRRNKRPTRSRPGTRDSATSQGLQALLDALAAADVAHLACHFDFDPEDPLGSILRLGAGHRLRDLVGHRLQRPVHLVLSACESGLTGVQLPDEAIGPAALLLAAGARSVTAALWPIDDQTAPEFMVMIHQRIADGRPPAEALAEAQRAALGSSPSCVWAAFAHNGP